MSQGWHYKACKSDHLAILCFVGYPSSNIFVEKGPSKETTFMFYFCLPNGRHAVAKMASHAIFQYNVLAIDDTHNTWTNICVKMIIIRLIGPRDEKIQTPEEIRLKGPRQR